MADLVSILIPVYNRAGMVDAAVRSAQAQTWPEIEIVVVDNASTDGTWERLKVLAERDDRVRIHRNERNLGPLGNWLACVGHARGRFAKILWSDDLIAPTFVERCLPFLASPDIGFVYTAVRIFQGDAPGADDRLAYQVHPRDDIVMPSRRYIEGIFKDGPFPFSPGCALFRLDDLRRNLWRDIPNRQGSDFASHAIGNDLLAFLLTAHAHARVAAISEPLAFFRDHPGSISTSSGPGRLVFHYDLVKAFFASTVLRQPRLTAALNARIHMHLRRFGPAPYGMTTVQDFHPEGVRAAASWTALAAMAAAKAVRDVRRLVRAR